LQEQLFGEIQTPLFEQTLDSFEGIPLQIGISQNFPILSLQRQLSGEIHFPKPEQTKGFDEFNPLHTGSSQLDP
jgi:hypothetical protein